jgi:hypothetical protein
MGTLIGWWWWLKSDGVYSTEYHVSLFIKATALRVNDGRERVRFPTFEETVANKRPEGDKLVQCGGYSIRSHGLITRKLFCLTVQKCNVDLSTGGSSLIHYEAAVAETFLIYLRDAHYHHHLRPLIPLFYQNETSGISHNTYIHIYRSRFIPEGVAGASPIFLRNAHVLLKLLSCEKYCRRDRWYLRCKCY